MSDLFGNHIVGFTRGSSFYALHQYYTKDIPESPTDVYFTSDIGGISKQYYSKLLMGSMCVTTKLR